MAFDGTHCEEALAKPPEAVGTAAPEASGQWRLVFELLGLGAIWGGSFLFMRVAAPPLGAVPLVEVRLVLATLVLLPFLWRVRARLTRRHWWRLALVGALSSALPFLLFAWAAQRAPAGISAIANSMTALFASLVAVLAFGERIGRARVVALAAGFAGVVVLAGGDALGTGVGLAALAGTVASLCYGVAANLLRHYLADLPPRAVAAGTLLCASLMLAPLAVWTWPQAPVPMAAWASAASLGVICTGLAYAIYFRLIQRVGASRASTVTYVVPLFGVAWAWIFLGEPLTVSMAVAGSLILGSVLLSNRAAH